MNSKMIIWCIVLKTLLLNTIMCFCWLYEDIWQNITIFAFLQTETQLLFVSPIV